MIFSPQSREDGEGKGELGERIFDLKTTHKMMLRHELDELSSTVIGAAIEVHKNTGPGLLESVYEHCLVQELRLRGVNVQSQVKLPIIYKGVTLDKYFNIDILVKNEIILELKSVTEIHPIHEAQVITYLKMANKRLGYLLNFNAPTMKAGIRRRVNNF
jgi:GxxExxY protein